MILELGVRPNKTDVLPLEGVRRNQPDVLPLELGVRRNQTDVLPLEGVRRTTGRHRTSKYGLMHYLC